MELAKFTENFAAQFEDTDLSLFTPSTEFRTLEEWSSLVALSIIAMVDEEYEVQLKGADMIQAQTIADIYKIVESRL